ncbi:MAG: universal stress protein [Kouleothrix sp.]|nr:universal stress protein [Kouleothrix sp.]
MRKILVPLDGSALAERALPQIRLLARALGARVHLLRVISHADHDGMVAHESLLLARGGAIPPLQTREQHAWKQLQTHADRYLAAQAGLLRRAGIDVEAEISVGQPAKTIVQVAARRLRAGAAALAGRAEAGHQLIAASRELGAGA